MYTVAGDGTQGFAGDGGSAIGAELDQPTGVAVDAGGDLLIADSNNDRVRLVAGSDCSLGRPFGRSSLIEGDIYSVIGNGTPMISGNGGGATSAQVGSPFVATDAGGDVLLSGDTQVRLVAGSDCSSACPFGLPSMTRGDIYAVAGTDTFGFAGDGGPATSAELLAPARSRLMAAEIS